MAKEANLSEEEYRDQIIKACFLDEDDPIKKWKESELYKNGKLIENETGAYSMYGLRIINGDAYCRGFDFWQGQAQSPVISKNMKPVLGGFKPEGSFWISNNGDIYTSEPDDEYSEDDDFTYLLVSKNGKNPKKVKGYPGIFLIEDGKSYIDRTNEDDEKYCKKWEDILDEMIWTFDQIINETDMPEPLMNNIDTRDKYREDMEKYNERIQRGLDTFAKYFRSLWD